MNRRSRKSFSLRMNFNVQGLGSNYIVTETMFWISWERVKFVFYCSLLVTCAMAIYNTIYAPTRCMHFKHLTVKMFSFGYRKSILNTANCDRMYFDIMEWIESHVLLCNNIIFYVILACYKGDYETFPLFISEYLSFFWKCWKHFSAALEINVMLFRVKVKCCIAQPWIEWIIIKFEAGKEEIRVFFKYFTVKCNNSLLYFFRFEDNNTDDNTLWMLVTFVGL